MTQVMEPTTTGQAQAHETDSPEATANLAKWMRGAGILMLVISAFGGIFPYFANGLGLPIDGYPDGVMTLWRTVLHLVPGTVGVLAAIYLLAWSRRLAARAPAPGGGRSALAVIRVALATGVWFWVGPYLWSLVQPSDAIGTGGLAGMVKPMTSMSMISRVIMPTSGPDMPKSLHTVTCIFTMGVCHWAVGVLVLAAALIAMGVGLRRGPVARLAQDGFLPIPALSDHS